MRFLSDALDKQAILDQVLPEHKKLCEAPASLQELDGYSSEFTAEQLSQFQSLAMAAERHRRYKWADSGGNVYLSMNPWARPIETRTDGTCWVVHPKPQLVMSYVEAKRVAVLATSSTSSVESVGALGNPAGYNRLSREFEY